MGPFLINLGYLGLELLFGGLRYLVATKEADEMQQERTFEKLKHNLHKTRESAVKFVEIAQNACKEGSFGSAAGYLKKAIDEWNKVKESKKYKKSGQKIKDMNIDKKIYADMLYFYGLMLYKTEKYDKSIDCLKESLDFDGNSVLTYNVLAIICFSQGKQAEAKRYFEESAKLNKYYNIAFIFLTLLNEDYQRFGHHLDQIFKSDLELIDPDSVALFFLAAAEVKLKQDKPLEAVKWLNKGIEFAKPKKNLWSTLLVNLYLKRAECYRELAEIKDYKKIALGEIESLSLDLDKAKFLLSEGREFIQIDPRRIDKRITNKFSLNFRGMIVNLRHDEIAKTILMGNIVHHIVSSTLFGKDEDGKKLRSEYESLRQSQEEELKIYNALIELDDNDSQSASAVKIEEKKGKINEFSQREDVIGYFIQHHLFGKGWLPWFSVASEENIDNNNEIRTDRLKTLLEIACSYNNICLFIYDKFESGKEIVLKRKIPPRDKRKFKVLRVLYQNGELHYSLLHEIKKTSTYCKHLWIEDHWEVLELDPNNVRAIQFFADQGILEFEKKLAALCKENDTVKALKYYQFAADQGDDDAKKQRQELLEIAAHNGIKEAQFELGCQCLKNSPLNGLQWLKKAADQNHDDAKKELQGNINHFIQRAEQGDTDAQDILANIYVKGLGLRQNIRLAAVWYQRATNQDVDTAITTVENLYKENYGSFLRRFFGFFNYNFDFSQEGSNFDMAWMRHTGQGLHKNMDEAFQLYEKGSTHERLVFRNVKYKCLNNLGLMYDIGQGVDQNSDKAKECYQRAAPHLPEAKLNLAILYLSEIKYEKARISLEELPEDINRKYVIKGFMLQYGLGFEKDLEEAKKQYQRSKDPLAKFFISYLKNWNTDSSEQEKVDKIRKEFEEFIKELIKEINISSYYLQESQVCLSYDNFIYMLRGLKFKQLYRVFCNVFAKFYNEAKQYGLIGDIKNLQEGVEIVEEDSSHSFWKPSKEEDTDDEIPPLVDSYIHG